MWPSAKKRFCSPEPRCLGGETTFTNGNLSANDLAICPDRSVEWFSLTMTEKRSWYFDLNICRVISDKAPPMVFSLLKVGNTNVSVASAAKRGCRDTGAGKALVTNRSRLFFLVVKLTLPLG